MKCKNCKREIDNDSIFCKWCGLRQIREAKKEVRIPEPKQKPSGKWFIQLRLGGKSYSITEDTEAKCRARAAAVKAGLIEEQKKGPKTTVGQAIDKYLAANAAVLSPSTMRSYNSYRKHRFQSVMSKDIHSKIDWQTAISDELSDVGAKTVINAWRLITPSLKFCGVKTPDVNLPKSSSKELPWLDHKQIQIFCDAIKGEPFELAALLALHSMRMSEFLALDTSKVDMEREVFIVSGASVVGEDQKLIYKDLNKNKSSQREIPFLIPRVKELIPSGDHVPLVTTLSSTLWKQLNRVCKAHNLPEVGPHGLRRSFASLAYHLNWPERQTMEIGGWSDYRTMHNIYIKLAEDDKLAAAQAMKDYYATATKFATESQKA